MSPSHWAVLAVGLVFFGLQLYACLRFVLLMRSWRSVIHLLVSGDSAGRAAYAKRFPWLGWVHTHFPQGEEPRGNYSRDDVAKELDSRIASNNEFVLLQRMGAMAPLLGVLLTVGSFIALNPQPDELRDLLKMFQRLAPIAGGIGVGALLALVNQWLLHFASRSAEHLRRTARDWFDTRVWDALGNKTKSSSERVMESLAELADSSRHSSEQQHACAELMVQAAGAIGQASVALESSTSAFTAQLSDLPEELEKLRAATQHAVAAIEVLAPAGERVMAGLEQSVTAFREAVVDPFGEAARLHQRSMTDIGEAAEVLRTSSRVLFNECEAIHASVRVQSESLDALNASLQQQVLPANQAFYNHVSKFNGSAEELFDRMNALYQEVAEGMERLSSLTPAAAAALTTLTSTAALFRQAVETDFAPAAQGHREQQAGLATTLQTMAEGVEQLRTGSRHLAETAAAQSQYSQSLQNSVEQEMLPAQGRLTEAVAAISPVALELSQQVQSLGQSIAAAQAEITAAGPQVRQVLGEIQPALDQFRRTLTEDFTTVAGQQREAVEQLVGAAGELAAAIGQIDQVGGKWSSLIDSQQAARDRYQTSLDETVLPAHRQMSGAADEFNASLGRFREVFESALGQLTQFDPQVRQAIEQLTPTLAAFRQTVEGDLSESARGQTEAIASLAAAASQLNTAAETLRHGGESVTLLLDQQQQRSAATGPAHDALQQAVAQLGAASASLQASLQDEIAPASRSMQEAAESFQGSAGKLSAFIEQGLEPATARLGQLDASLARLETLTESCQSLAGASDKILALSQSLAQAAQIAEALDALPEKLQTALEKLAENHSRKSWFPFLSSEKRSRNGP